MSFATPNNSSSDTPKNRSKKAILALSQYHIKSYGGIGDEREKYGETRERPKHNLSGSCHELMISTGTDVHRILIDM
jgi:hypothetical protein